MASESVVPEMEPAELQAIDLEGLAKELDVQQDALQLLACSQDGKLIVSKFAELVASKNETIEEYENTIREVTDSMDAQTQEKDQELEELRKSLEAESALRSELQAAVTNSETSSNSLALRVEAIEEQLAETQQELDETRQELREAEDIVQSKQRDLDEADEQTEQLKIELEATTKSLGNIEADLAGSQERVAELSVPPPEVPGADRQELLRILDRREHEVSRVADEWKKLSEQLEITTAKKSEFQSRLDELAVQGASLRLKEKLLQNEKSLLKNQNQWLSNELQSKSEQLLKLRKDSASSQSALEAQLTQKQDEVKSLSGLLEEQRKAYTSLEGQTQEVMTKTQEGKEEMASLEEHLRAELSQQAKLAELYKSASEDSAAKITELLSRLDQVQGLLLTAIQEKEQLQAQLEVETTRYETVERDLSTSLASHKQELSQANELVTSLRKRGNSPSQLEALGLSPAAARASQLLKSGKTLTQIYSEHVEVCDQLEVQKQENQTLNNYIEQIVEELAEKAPALQKLRRDYEASVNKCNTLNQKLDMLTDELETTRLENEDSVKQYGSSQRENKRLKELAADLGRQVKILLKECEEARGGVASSRDYHMELSSGDISSSSQTISQQLVEFRNIEQLQEQNQKLLMVVRELSEQNEERERETLDQRTQELRTELDQAVGEVRELQDSRHRQEELVKSIVQQRDMYRTLLAQATPLPVDSTREEPAGESGTVKELKEVKEQFEAYRKEKATNDDMLRTQLEEMRDKCSELRLQNAKLESKHEYANDRYKLLDNQTTSLKKELDALRGKNLQLSNALSSHQATISSSTQELLEARERIAKAEVTLTTLRSERDLLEASERRARDHYEEILRDQKGHQVLLTNLQSIQNNLEKSEFDTKTRLGSQIEALERELSLYKERLHCEEERRNKTSEAYQTQVRDLETRLSALNEDKALVDKQLKESESLVVELQSQCRTIQESHTLLADQHKEASDKILRLEAAAGAEFRGKIRLLERQLADSKVKVQGLESQLESSKKSEEQYKSIAEVYETQLAEHNDVHEKYKNKMEAGQAELEERVSSLSSQLEELEATRNDLSDQLSKLAEKNKEQLSELEATVDSLRAENTGLQSTLADTKDQLGMAKADFTRFVESATETQGNYERELTQHGKTMEQLLTTKEELSSVRDQLSVSHSTTERLTIEVAAANTRWKDREELLTQQCASLESRVTDLTNQNNVLHQEAEKLSARVLTLQEGQGLDTSVGSLDTSGGQLEDKSSEQLWEIIRYVRREKEIANTRRELAEGENTMNKQVVENLKQQLTTAQGQLKELTEAAQLHRESASQHEEILAKVESLNVLSDSNKLLRGERDRQTSAITILEGKCEQLQSELGALRESNNLLTHEKDALQAEKLALRNEAQLWRERTDNLIEEYNTVDPEEYQKLLKERDSYNSQVTAMKQEIEALQSGLAALHSDRGELEARVTSLTQECEQLRVDVKVKDGLAEEVKQLQADVSAKAEDIKAKTVLVGKLRDVGRKYRKNHEDSKKELEETTAQLEETRRKLEEAQTAATEASPAPPAAPTPETEELEKANTTIEGLKTSYQTLKDKYDKAVKTVKAARGRLETLKSDNEKATKDTQAATAECDKLRSDQQASQQELTAVKQSHEAETAKLNATITKLQQALKERGPRRKVVPPSISEGSSATQPRAAVKPTVTTTPTASIRPIAIQTTTTAPTAHVTPIAPVNSTQHSTTATATVFVRTSSTQVTARLPSTSVVSSSLSAPSMSTQGIVRASSQRGGEDSSRGVTKRQREEEDQEGGATTSAEPPASKRKKPLAMAAQRLGQQQVEPVASSSPSPDTQGEALTASPEEASDSQVLAAETQTFDQSHSQDTGALESNTVVPESDMDSQPSVEESVEPMEDLEAAPSPQAAGESCEVVTQSQEPPSVESSQREATETNSEAEMMHREPSEGPLEPQDTTAARPDSHVPVSQPDSHVPVLQPDSHVPMSQPDSHVPVSQPDSHVPVSQPDSHVPVSQPDSHVPVSQPDSNLPVDSSEITSEETSTSLADTTQTPENEGSRRGTSEPLSEVAAEELAVEPEETGGPLEPDREEDEQEEERGMPEESEPSEEMEEEPSTEDNENEESDEGAEEEGDSSSGEEDGEYYDEDDGTEDTPIVIDSSSDTTEFAIRLENVTDSDESDEESGDRPMDEDSHDPAPGSHDQADYQFPGGGLPEDEPSVNLETVHQPPRPTFIPSVRRVLSQGLGLSGERNTSAVTPVTGFEATAEDSVVPHTPVLEGGKQLGLTARAQSLPTAERPAPQPTTSSLTSQTLQASEFESTTIQSLGESHIDISSAALVPPMTRELGEPSQLAASEGDIPYSFIEEIVGSDSSSSDEGDEEEGQIEDEQEEVERDSAQPAVSTASSIPEQVNSPPVGPGEDSSDKPPPPKRKPRPIVWSQPPSSAGPSTGTARRGTGRKINIPRKSGPTARRGRFPPK